ncbi:nuclear transport factor 2 family protein [Pectobacterium aroidearum]|uniref:nuclear transport factor 2 family protein n=1 Tax=Pectobacterium aroidearum TaxID=1201031 RepID=UPI0032EF8D83
MLATSLISTCAQAQTPAPQVAGNPDALFTSPDPVLNANKQVVYRILRDLLDAGQWDKADELLSEEYLQHNPNAQSGRAAVVDYFTKVLKVKPRPLPERLNMKVIAVLAEGDLVTVLYPRTVSDPNAPGGSYKTTWYDTWRIRDGKAVEHWDPALLNEAPDLR